MFYSEAAKNITDLIALYTATPSTLNIMFICAIGEVSCGPELSECYDIDERCDGKTKCSNGADELNCRPKSRSEFSITFQYD